jgi:hypothetical protein
MKTMSRITPDYQPPLVVRLFERLVKTPTNPTREELDQIAADLQAATLRDYQSSRAK